MGKRKKKGKEKQKIHDSKNARKKRRHDPDYEFSEESSTSSSSESYFDDSSSCGYDSDSLMSPKSHSSSSSDLEPENSSESHLGTHIAATTHTHVGSPANDAERWLRANHGLPIQQGTLMVEHKAPCNVDESDKSGKRRDLDPVTMDDLDMPVDRHVYVASGDGSTLICYNCSTLKSVAEASQGWRQPPDFRSKMLPNLRQQIIDIKGIDFMHLENEADDFDDVPIVQEGLWDSLIDNFIGPVSQAKLYACPVCFYRAESSLESPVRMDPLLVLLRIGINIASRFVFRRQINLVRHLNDHHQLAWKTADYPLKALKEQIYQWLSSTAGSRYWQSDWVLKSGHHVRDAQVDVNAYWREDQMQNRVMYNTIVHKSEEDQATSASDTEYYGPITRERDGELADMAWACVSDSSFLDDEEETPLEITQEEIEKEVEIVPRSTKTRVIDDSESDSIPVRRRIIALNSRRTASKATSQGMCNEDTDSDDIVFSPRAQRVIDDDDELKPRRLRRLNENKVQLRDRHRSKKEKKLHEELDLLRQKRSVMSPIKKM